MTAPIENGGALRMSGEQHSRLKAYLFPGDGKEAVAVALCGRAGTAPSPYRVGKPREVICVHQIEPVPYGECDRDVDRVTWSTRLLQPLLHTANRRGMAVLKIHSHPTGYPRFSPTDDCSDSELFESITNYIDGSLPHASAVMLPDGRVFARFVATDGSFIPIDAVSVVGNDWRIWHADESHTDWPTGSRVMAGSDQADVASFSMRTAQAFGAGTVAKLARLSVAVVGASGTGSPTIEMVARLGVGELVTADPDIVEEKNRNRILHSSNRDVRLKRKKVRVLASAVRRMGLGTRVVPIEGSLWDPGVVARIAECDVVIGCMDSIDGRDLLNRLATYYSIPYIDVGVFLEADGRGGVSQISGSVHYLFPGGSSLVSRGVFTPEDILAAVLYRTEPAAYREQKAAKYIRGVNEDRPAVISVNMLYASLAVNELLARIHGFRDDPNEEFARTQLSLTQGRMVSTPEGAPCPRLAGKVGRGDLVPLLDTPALSLVEDEGL
jgi:hypothetical protein